MSDVGTQKGGHLAAKLVWIITLLGLGSGLFMIAIVYWTLTRIHSEREYLGRFQQSVTSTVTSIDSFIVQGRDNVNALLNGEKNTPLEPQWVVGLENLIQGKRSIDIEQEKQLHNIFDSFKNQLADVKQLHRDCTDYNARYIALQAVFPVIQERTATSLSRLRVAIIGLEGRQRLQQAIRINRYRQSGGNRADTLAHAIIKEMTQTTGAVAIKTEISDLALLSERLLGEDQIDFLADLKDNQFKASLDRLRRSLGSMEKRIDLKQTTPLALLEEFEIELFGQGFTRDDIHQTIIPGRDGLYLTCRDRLVLAEKRKALTARVNRLFDSIREIRMQLVHSMETSAQETAKRAETALETSWQTMMMVGMIVFSIFLILSIKIARAVKRQIKAIEDTNESLTTEVNERTRVESELIQSQAALHQAKDELEMRVEERTSELKQTNRLLGREVTERKRAEGKLRQRTEELSKALKITRRAQRISEAERDKSSRMLLQVTESKRRLEILLSDATAREQHMVTLKREVNSLLQRMGRRIKYNAPHQVDAFLGRDNHRR